MGPYREGGKRQALKLASDWKGFSDNSHLRWDQSLRLCAFGGSFMSMRISMAFVLFAPALKSVQKQIALDRVKLSMQCLRACVGHSLD